MYVCKQLNESDHSPAKCQARMPLTLTIDTELLDKIYTNFILFSVAFYIGFWIMKIVKQLVNDYILKCDKLKCEANGNIKVTDLYFKIVSVGKCPL